MQPTTISFLFPLLGLALGVRAATAHTPDMAEEFRRATEEARERLRRHGLPLLLHDFGVDSPRAGRAQSGSAPPQRDRTAGVRVWSLVVENVSPRAVRVRAVAESDGQGSPCAALELRGPASVSAAGYAVFAGRTRASCGYRPHSIWIDSQRVGEEALPLMSGPYLSVHRRLDAPATMGGRLLSDPCPVGLRHISPLPHSAPQRRHSSPAAGPPTGYACPRARGVSFGSAARYCDGRGMRLPTRREAFYWFGARHRFRSGGVRADGNGPFPLIWTSSLYHGSNDAVWVLDFLRATMVGQMRDRSALALCVGHVPLRPPFAARSTHSRSVAETRVASKR